MVRTSAFFGSVTPKAFCQKRLKLSFGFAELVPHSRYSVPAPFFFGSFGFAELAEATYVIDSGLTAARFFLDEQKEMNIKKAALVRQPL